MRLPTRTVATTGDKVEQQQLDLSFLQVGTTPRDEVLEKLAVIKTGYSTPQVFWGRWFVSKWGGGVIVVGWVAEREWKVNNLLVLFGENGVVTGEEVITHDKALWREISSHLQDAPALDLSTPATVDIFAWGEAGALITLPIRLTNDEMDIPDTMTKPRRRPLRTSPQEVTRISYKGPPSPGGHDCGTLYFAKKTAFGKTFPFCTDGSNLAVLLQYLHQTHPGGMRWE